MRVGPWAATCATFFIPDQFVADRGAVLRRHQHIKVAYRVATPTIAAGNDHAAATAQIPHQRLSLGFGDRELEPLGRLRLFERAQQLLLHNGTESPEFAQPSGLDCLLKFIEGAHFQPVIEQLDALRPQSWESRHVAEFTRQLLLQLVEQAEMPGLDDIGDLAGEVLADPRQFRQIASGLQQSAGCLRQPFDDARGAAIGANTKLIFSADLQKLGSLVEQGRDFRILHGHVGDL